MDSICYHAIEASDVIPMEENKRASVDLVKSPSGDFPNIYERKFFNTRENFNACDIAVMGLEEKVYVFGGYPCTNKCWVYYYDVNTW